MNGPQPTGSLGEIRGFLNVTGSAFRFSCSSLFTLPAGGVCRPYVPPCVLRLMPISLQVRASLVEAPLLSASTNDRCGIRVDRLFPPACLRFPRHCSCVTVSGRFVCSCNHKLSSHFHFHFTPTPTAAPPVSGSLQLQCAPIPPLAIPTRKDRHPLSGLQSAHCRHSPPSSHP